MKRLTHILFLLALLAPAVFTGDFVSNSQSCPASGNKQISATSYQLFQLTVSANISNTGTVYVGGSNVTTSTGVGLVAGGSYNASKPNNGINPQSLYIACSSSGDGITWIGTR